MLQDHKGQLNFATNAWILPNHKVFIMVTIHFKTNGMSMSMLLDLLGVAMSHPGVNLAVAFAQILDEFGISVSAGEMTILTSITQVLGIICENTSPNDTMIDELIKLICSFPGASNYAQ